MSHEGDARREIEVGLGSVGKIRIMGVMARNPEEFFTKYMLERRTGLKAMDVRDNLRVLVDLGWIREYDFQPKKYRINLENDRAKRLSDFLKGVNYI